MRKFLQGNFMLREERRYVALQHIIQHQCLVDVIE
ncbi:hypothetical protein NSE_0096 [Neorickettsia sennetsu str. Miyayama]|uniref:Uncharacterized protein n=1 Tax=Ehrlichia sennetsu (strain ATCC VR-367 / Miyayama) TaxID=222891 RepID=Q2GEV0_EHRS3|nr:hypothetical protein NSE_0096 [Neorickettsia sennetsu str. Miyayama]